MTAGVRQAAQGGEDAGELAGLALIAPGKHRRVALAQQFAALRDGKNKLLEMIARSAPQGEILALDAFIRESIVDPNAYIEKGYPKGVMPETFS